MNERKREEKNYMSVNSQSIDTLIHSSACIHLKEVKHTCAQENSNKKKKKTTDELLRLVESKENMNHSSTFFCGALPRLVTI